MNNQEIFENLKNIVKDTNIKKNEPMKNHTTFRIGGPADIFIKVCNINELQDVLKFAKYNNIPITIIGNGSNILVSDSGIRGIVLKLEMMNIEIEQTDNYSKIEKNEIGQLVENNQKSNDKKVHAQDRIKKVTVQSGVQMGFLAQTLLQHEIAGFENLAGIPGTVGGAIIMNAGAHGKEMKDIVFEVNAMDYDGNIHKFSNEESEFRYRGSKFSDGKYIILSTKLLLSSGTKEDIQTKMNEYLQLRKEKQPLEFPSAGSTFKRGTDFITAALIDQAGLKGYTIGEAQVSEKHAGFIINKGGATAQDVLDLVKYVQDEVYKKFGKKIELEVKVLGS